MKLLPTLVLVTALGFGAAGAATAYRLAAPAEPTASAQTAVVVPAAEPAARAPRPAHVFRWAPCPRGTVLKGKTCVRTVIHRVPRAVPVPAPTPVPVAAPAATHPSPHPSAHPGARPGAHEGDQAQHEDDGGREHEDDGGGEHEDD